MVDSGAGGPVRSTINAVFLSVERVRYPIAQFLFCRERTDVAELAIVLEALFIEPLVCGGIVRKRVVNSGVSEQILWVVPFQRRLEIQKDAVIALLARGVVDSAQIEVLADLPIFAARGPESPE